MATIMILTDDQQITKVVDTRKACALKEEDKTKYPATRDQAIDDIVSVMSDIVDGVVEADKLNEKKRTERENADITLEVRDTAKREDLEFCKGYLTSEWCKCGKPEFLCYPEDGECPCGVHKHHVHCKNCGGIMQVG